MPFWKLMMVDNFILCGELALVTSTLLNTQQQKEEMRLTNSLQRMWVFLLNSLSTPKQLVCLKTLVTGHTSLSKPTWHTTSTHGPLLLHVMKVTKVSKTSGMSLPKAECQITAQPSLLPSRQRTIRSTPPSSIQKRHPNSGPTTTLTTPGTASSFTSTFQKCSLEWQEQTTTPLATTLLTKSTTSPTTRHSRPTI